MSSPEAPNRAGTAQARLAQIEAQQQRARAAAVVQAAGQSGRVVIDYLRANPVMLLGSVAALFGVAFGIYVYLQIAHPGIFVRQAATRPQENAPPTPGAAPVGTMPPSQAVSAAPPPAEQPLTPVVVVPAPPAASAPTVALPAAGTVGTPPAPPPQAQPPSLPLPTSSVIGSSAGTEPTPRDTGPRIEVTREPASVRPRVASAKSAAASRAAVAEAPSAARERINVSQTGNQPRLNPLLTQAYAHLQTGDLAEARGAYSKVSQAEPLNVDALLGLAYIAAQENRTEDATKLYVRILQLNPRHAAAQGALIGLVGRADAGASEARLKQLIAREPTPFLHFVLGNLYADQSMWSQAQQSYFQAHHLEPDNADYAYNLAVSLDHLRQPKLALNFYRRAEQLASSQARGNFNLSHARERIGTLASQVD